MNVAERIDANDRLAVRLLILICLLSVAGKLYHITAPIADRHSWNQCSTASVIRHLYADGYDWLHPQWDLLDKDSNAPNIEAEEAPVYPMLVAGLYRITGETEWAARAVTIALSLAGGVFLFLLVRIYYENAAALLATLFYFFAPLNWFFHRAVMSDAGMVTAIIGSILFFDRWTRTKGRADYLAALACTALAGLFKPFGLHVGIPLLYLSYRTYGWRFATKPALLAFGVLAVLPTVLWLVHATSIGGLGNVSNEGGIFGTKKLWGEVSLLWSPAFYYRMQWRLFDRAATPLITALALIGVLASERKKGALFYFWLLGVAAYILIIRSGNEEHNYYQMPYVPPACVLAAVGLRWLGSAKRIAPGIRTAIVVVALVGFMTLAGIYAASHFRMDLSSYKAGVAAKEHSQPGDLILVWDPGSTRKNQAVYYSRRNGWHVSNANPETLDRYRGLGASRLVLALSEDQQQAHAKALSRLSSEFPILYEQRGDMGLNAEPHLIRIYDIS